MRSLTSEAVAMSYKRLTMRERVKIEALHDSGMSARAIARELGRCHTTILRELAKGSVDQMNWLAPSCEELFQPRYFADTGQLETDRRRLRQGAKRKVVSEGAARELGRLMKRGYSPYASLVLLQGNGRTPAGLGLTTLYRRIHSGELGFGDEVLCCGRYRTKGKKEAFDKRRRYHGSAERKSIEDRPLSVLKREEFGHWEGDTVVGAKGGKGCLLTLVERKTRFSLIVWLENRKAETIKLALDGVERRFGSRFKEVFKTITFDNGSEFAHVGELKASCYGGRRFGEVYYAHPFCSSERGSNEVMHRFIRRRYPKGTIFDCIGPEEVGELCKWINGYPRRQFGGKSSQSMFYEELRKT